MQPWTGAIVEWLNCLGVHQSPLKNVRDLQNEDIYIKIICRLTDCSPESTSYEQVSNFLNKEYPDFLLHQDPTDEIPNDVYIASLLLLTTSQKVSFHRPMCNLHHDTQILIKRFLEAVLPYGASITRDILTSTISELSDATPRTPPVTPKGRPLRNFFTSPAAQSAHRHRILNEKTRELRLLKAELETERYEKVDLQEDLKIREEKIQILQKNLNEKTQELKALKADRCRPRTPQSARKSKKSVDEEQMLKKEIQHLENFNSTLQDQLNSLESEKEELLRRLTSKERLSLGLKEKVETYERNLEALGIQLDQKSTELLDLRLQNEELRSHIKDMQRCSVDVDHSFEIYSVSSGRTSSPGLNTSEALSSIVDIQLQEAREESLKLKSQLDSLHLQLDKALRNCEEFQKVNGELLLKADDWNIVKGTLEETEAELMKMKNKVESIEEEKKNLESDLDSLRDALAAKEAIFNETNEKCISLNFKVKNQLLVITKMEQDMENLNLSLTKQNEILNQMSAEKEIKQNDLDDSKRKIRELEISLDFEISKSSEISTSSEEKIKILEEKISLMGAEKEKLEENIKEKTIALEETLNALNNKVITIDSLNTHVVKLQDDKSTQEIVLKGLEMKLCELNELKEELQSQVDEERKNVMRISGEKENLHQSLMTSNSEKTKLMERFIKLKSDFDEMTEKAEELDKQSKTNEEKYQRASAKIQLLLSETERLNSELSASVSSMSQLQELQENLENQLTQQQESSMKLITEKANLEHELSNKTRDNCDLSQRAIDLEAQLNKTLQELQDLENLHGDLQATHQKTGKTVQKLESEVLKSNNDLKKFISEISEMKSLINSLEHQLDEEKTSIKSLLHEKSTLENELSSSEGERTELMEKLSLLQENLTNSEKKIDKIQKKSDELKSLGKKREKQIGDQQAEITDLNRELKNVVSERKSLEESLQSLAEKSNSEILELKSIQETLKRQLEGARENLKILGDEKSAINYELSIVQGEKKKLRENFDSLEAKLTKAKGEIADIQGKYEESEKKNSDTVDKINSMNLEIEKLNSELNNATLERESVKDNITRLSERTSLQISALQETQKSLEAQLELARDSNRLILDEKASITTELSILKEENNNLRENLNANDQKLTESNKKIQQLQKYSDELHRKCEESTGKITLMTSEIENLNLNLQETISARHNVQNNLTELKIQWKSLRDSNEVLLTEKSSLSSELTTLQLENKNLLEQLDLNKTKLIESEEKIEQLQNHSEQLQQKYKNSTEKIDLMTCNVENLTTKLEKTISECETLQNNLTHLHEELEGVNTELAAERESNQTLSTEKLTLTSELSNVKEDNNDLVVKLTELERKVEHLQNDYEELQQTYNKSIEKINLLNSEVENLTFKLEETISERDSLQNNSTDLMNQMRNLNNQLSAERDCNQTLLEEKSSLTYELSNIRQENNNLLNNLSSHEEKLKESLKKIDDLQSSLKQLQQKYEESTGKIISTTTEIENLALKLKRTISARDSLKNDLMKQITDLTAQLEVEKDSNQALSTEKLSLITELSMLKEENDELLKNLNSHEEKLKQLQRNVGDLQNDSEKLQEKEKESIKEIALLNSEVENLTLKLQKAILERDSLENHLTDLQEKLSSSETELKAERDCNQTLMTEKSSLTSELSSLKEENQNLLQNLSSHAEKLKESTRNIDDLHQKCTESAEKITSLTSQIENLRLKLQETISSRDSTQDNLTDVTKHLEIAQMESKKYQQQIEELTATMKHLETLHEERETASKDLMVSLEKRLLVSQNTHETLKIDQKLKEEAVEVLQSKLQDLTREKIESELKMKEIIMNLQEIRVSQDAVMETQSKALVQKSLDFETLEKEHLTLKQTLEKQINLQNLKTRELSKELDQLKQSHENSLKNLEELHDTLKVEKEKLRFVNQQLHTTEEKKTKITELSKLVISKLSKLTKIITNGDSIGPEQVKDEPEDIYHSFDDPDLQELSKTMQNVAKSTKSSEKTLFSLFEEKKKLLEDLEEEKQKCELVFKEQLKTQELSEKIISLESSQKRREELVASLISQKQHLQGLLSDVIASRDEVEKTLSSVHDSWTEICLEKQSLLTANSSACDEVKHLDAIKLEIQKLMNEINARNSESFQPLIKGLSRVLSWSKQQLEEVSSSIFVKIDSEDDKKPISPVVSIKPDPDDLKTDLSPEESLLKSELQKTEEMKTNLTLILPKIAEFKSLINAHEANIKSGVVKREPTLEEKLQTQVDRLSKEKKEMKEKLDAMRVRNAKMEKNMDDLRTENKKLKIEVSSASPMDTSQVERLQSLVSDLTKENEELKRIKDELEKRLIDQDFDAKLREVHDEYGQKLEKIKQKMKLVYNEQATKMQIEQDRIISEKTAAMKEKMEAQCRKYAEDINKYKAHVKDMSSQYWNVGEKLLAEKQEKEIALQRVQELERKHERAIAEASHQMMASQSQMRSASLDRGFEQNRSDLSMRTGFRTVQVIEEQTMTRRHSVKSIQAMGNAFRAEDEDEIFDNVYLADLKEGQFRAIEPQTDFDRLSELRMRNSLCRPHLKSSYAVETHLHPVALTEEDIKSGPHEDMFNDSLSQSLLPGQKTKKRDRTQTSYKRPGPPTPSKNGGRLSLQGNELKSPNSRILREKNVDRRTTATPKSLKAFFGTSLSRRQDENAPSTPKGRRLSNIFRKPKTERS